MSGMIFVICTCSSCFILKVFRWKSYAIFWLACRWDGGNSVFQVNQSAITSKQQLTVWGKKRGAAVGSILFQPPLSLFLTVQSSIWDQLSSILTPSSSYTLHLPYLSPILIFCDILPTVTKSHGTSSHMWHNEDIRCMSGSYIAILMRTECSHKDSKE